MIKHLHLILISVSLLMLNCGSDDDAPTCPENEIASFEINGELKQFQVNGRGIDLDNDGTGHTLSLYLMTGELQPQGDSYQLIIKLPYKQTGTNIIEEFFYDGVENGTSTEIDFVVEGELASDVMVNTNTCFSATFSGSVIVDGTEITIENGILKHVYDDPFD